MGHISVAFVDDHPVLLSGVCQLFAQSNEFQVVGVGRNASDIVALAETVAPDVLVVDLGLPGRSLEAIARVAGSGGPTRIVAFTANMSAETAIAALEAGALGYVLKGSTMEELTEAIRQVSAGETYITPSFAAKVVNGLRQSAQATQPARITFSRREEDVLRLLLQGSTNKEIAEALQLSDKTVKHYMTVLIQKLNVRNRVEVVLAMRELRDEAQTAPTAVRLAKAS